MDEYEAENFDQNAESKSDSITQPILHAYSSNAEKAEK